MSLQRIALTAATLLFASTTLAGCGSSDETKADSTPSPSPSSSSPTQSPSSSESAVSEIEYDGEDGVAIEKPADVEKLHDASSEFKEFIKGEVTKLNKSDCTDGYVGIHVNNYTSAGFARGAVNDCGGHQVIWKQDGQTWSEVWGGQEPPECAKLKALGVPRFINEGECFVNNELTKYEGP